MTYVDLKNWHPSNHIACAVAALMCPVIAFSSTFIYQLFTYSEFWNSLEIDGEGTTDAAGAMMTFAQFIQLIFFTMIGCFFGIISGVISFWLWHRSKHQMPAVK